MVPGLTRELRSVMTAAYALSRPAVEIERPVKEISRRQQSQDRQLIKRMAATKMKAYSVEEIRRALAVDHPHLTKAYVDRVIAPKLTLDRPVDRFGPEPHFLIAAKLAHHMLGAPEGQSEADALAGFLSRNPMVKHVWPELSLEDLEPLRKIYPFLPRWEGGIKSSRDLTLEHPYDNAASLETRVWLQSTLDALDELSKIPIYSSVLEKVNQVRDEEGKLADTRLVDVTHAFADKIPMLQSLIAYDGLRGSDIRCICKHYSGNERVRDVMARVFGVEVEVASDDAEVASKAERAILDAVEGGDERKLFIHMGGVHRWHWVDQVAKDHPNVPIAGVSHTTSDGKDLLEGPEVSIPLEMMSLSEAKQNDERERFRHSLRALVDRLGYALDSAIYNRRFLLKGYGRIMGPAMAEALKGMEVDLGVNDRDPARAEAAGAAGLEVVGGIEEEKSRSLLVIGAANGQAMTPEEIEQIERPAIFLQVQTGREAFPMDWVLDKSRGPDGLPRRQVVGYLGDQPMVEYTLDINGRDITHTFVGDGYVANLAFPRPAITEYSIFTSLLILESIRESNWRLDEIDQGRDRQRGTHLLETTSIDMTPGKPRRFVTMWPRDTRKLVTKPLERLAMEQPDLSALLERTQDDVVLFRDATGKSAPPSEAIPKPGAYVNGAGYRMLETPATDGAWQAARPQTTTGRYAHALVSHSFGEDGTSFTYDGWIDDKGMAELIELGKKEKLIETDRKGRATNVDRFLDELRPYQLDFVQEGSRALRALQAEAGSDRVFFEVRHEWPIGRVWSDARANRRLAELIS